MKKKNSKLLIKYKTGKSMEKLQSRAQYGTTFLVQNAENVSSPYCFKDMSQYTACVSKECETSCM